MQASYDVEVWEDWEVTSPRPLITVRATDADEHSSVTYRFSDRTRDDYSRLFAVDRHSGLITLIRSIDYEQIRSVYSAALSAGAENSHDYTLLIIALQFI